MKDQKVALQDLFHSTAACAKEVFLRTGKHAPQWVIETPTGIEMLVTPWGSDETKHTIISRVRKLCRAHKAERVVFIAEAWCLVVRPDELNSLSSRPIRERKERQECLVITAQDTDGNHLEGKYMIQRDDKGKASLTDFEAMPGVVLGNLLNILTPPETNHQNETH